MDSPHAPLVPADFDIGRELLGTFDAALRRYREAGVALDGSTVSRLRGIVRRELLASVKQIIEENLHAGQLVQDLTASGDVEQVAELRRRWPALRVRIR